MRSGEGSSGLLAMVRLSSIGGSFAARPRPSHSGIAFVPSAHVGARVCVRGTTVMPQVRGFENLERILTATLPNPSLRLGPAAFYVGLAPKSEEIKATIVAGGQGP